MVDNNGEVQQSVCYACIGDDHLKSEVRREGTMHTCMICGKRKRAIEFGDLCDRVHHVVTEEFERTECEPESWAQYKEADIGWERGGDPIDQLLYEVLECESPLVDALKEELSNQHHSYEDALAGEEDPYGDEVHYEPKEPDDSEFLDVWSRFETEIRTRARFFSRNAESILEDIFGNLNRFKSFGKPLIRRVGPNTNTDVLYRARRALSTNEIAQIVEHPATELSAPPSRLTQSGRMNPRWISMFYGAFDTDTCIAEIRPPVGSYAVVGKFSIIRQLRFLDLEALQELFVKEASYFDPEFGHLRDKARFLRRLVSIMSRPVMPTDEDYQYLPTQAVAEYLSQKMKPRLDGLIFPSAQRGGHGENVVLFQHASTVSPDGSEELELETDFDSLDPDAHGYDITVRSRGKTSNQRSMESRSMRHRKTRLDVLDRLALWSDLADESPKLYALRIDPNSIEVRAIRSVEYKTRTRRVYRYRTDSDVLPF